MFGETIISSLECICLFKFNSSSYPSIHSNQPFPIPSRLLQLILILLFMLLLFVYLHRRSPHSLASLFKLIYDPGNKAIKISN